MQDERIKVSPVGPYDRSELIVYANLREEVGVGKWLEHWTVQLSGEVDITSTAITEAEPRDSAHAIDDHRPLPVPA